MAGRITSFLITIQRALHDALALAQDLADAGAARGLALLKAMLTSLSHREQLAKLDAQVSKALQDLNMALAASLFERQVNNCCPGAHMLTSTHKQLLESLAACRKNFFHHARVATATAAPAFSARLC